MRPQSRIEARNVVLVHGMLMDGSSWRAVRDRLAESCLNVTVVELPLSGVAADISATNAALEVQDGPTVLAGHSYGGLVVSEAGVASNVSALVYVAGLQPDVGETMGELSASIPSLLPADAVVAGEDGRVTLKPEVFAADLANGLGREQAVSLAEAQAPTSADVFSYSVKAAAWKSRPSYGIVATDDRTMSPDLETWMYERSQSEISKVKAGHLVLMTHPDAVADVILKAAGGAR